MKCLSSELQELEHLARASSAHSSRKPSRNNTISMLSLSLWMVITIIVINLTKWKTQRMLTQDVELNSLSMRKDLWRIFHKLREREKQASLISTTLKKIQKKTK